jgi:hypothetical protein
LVILATSREGLGIDGERILVVPSLASPGADADLAAVAQTEAVHLFVERAQAVKSDFTLTPENAVSVGQLCRRLDGIPLALELAAARIPAMNPGELARRLDRRFEVLAGGRRGAVERHQTLRAAIDWSYELATEPQRRLLGRLTVFAGGCTLEAAETVCAGVPVQDGAVWELMAGLVSQSLVVAEDHGLDTRYRLLETIRQYGEERLDEWGETAWLRGRHAEYYAGLASALGELMLGPDQSEAGPRLAAEQENLLRAMNTAMDTQDVDLAFRLLASVPLMSVQSGFGFQLPPEPALGLAGASEHPDYPLVVAIAAVRVAGQGETERAEQLCEEASSAEGRLGTHPDRLVEERVGAAKQLLALNRGSWHDAALAAERSVKVARSAGRLAPAAANLAAAGHSHAMAGDPDTGIPLATEGLALAWQVGMPYLIGVSLGSLANALVERDPERSRALLRESVQFAQSAGYESANQITVVVLVAGRLRDGPLVLELAPRAVRLLHWNGDRPQLAGVLNIVAWAAAEAEPDDAAILQGAARNLALGGSTPRMSSDQPLRQATGPVGHISELRRETSHRLVDTLGDQRLRDLRTKGEALEPDQTVSLALAVISRASGSNINERRDNGPPFPQSRS